MSSKGHRQRFTDDRYYRQYNSYDKFIQKIDENNIRSSILPIDKIGQRKTYRGKEDKSN